MEGLGLVRHKEGMGLVRHTVGPGKMWWSMVEGVIYGGTCQVRRGGV